MNLTPELTKEFDALKMELRGYEVARETDYGWEVTAKFRPMEMCRKTAIQMANWLTWRCKQRGDDQTYRVRPIVSIDVDFMKTVTGAENAEVTNFGDIIPAQPMEGDETSLLTGSTENLVRAKQDAAELAAGGFITSAGTVPFDYAKQSAEAQLGFDFGGES